MRRIWIALALLVLPSAAVAEHWFVDHTAGGANNGTSTTDAWTSIKSAVENNYATNPNYVHVRSTHRETLTENISWDLYEQIFVIGDDGTWWPGDDDKASFNTGGYQFESSGAHGSSSGMRNVCIQAGTGGGQSYCFYNYSDSYFQLADIDFSTYAGGVDAGMYIYSYSGSMQPIVGCTFLTRHDAPSLTGIYINRGTYPVTIDRCTFDGLAIGIRCAYVDLLCSNCEFAQTTPNTYDVQTELAEKIRLHNCIFAGDDPTVYYAGSYGKYYSEVSWTTYDVSNRPITNCLTAIADDIDRGHRMEATYGTARSGGSDYSIAFQGGATSSSVKTVLEFFVMADSAVSRDYSIYVQRDAAWDCIPTLEEVWLEVSYLNSGVPTYATGSTILASADTWYEYKVSGVTPDVDQAVIVRMFVNETDADGWLYFDPMLVTSTDETYEPKINWAEPHVRYVAPEEAGGSNSQIILIGADQRRPPDWYYARRRAGQ